MATDAYIDPDELLGVWDFEREIVDRVADQVKRVAGRTDLTATDDGRIRWYESGTLFDGDLQLQVFRTLFIEKTDGQWAATFEDGRDFHRWAPGEDVEHLCGADTYRGRIDVVPGAAATWTVVWTVTGPTKDYTMTTHLTRP
ncbi:hypothetical protein ABH922_003299 [Rhodococcus sp. 27YEA15]|uniref:DUF6314 family protein n=1 Tax=Rhodococcus sp. 27YEA15 TaxID=3156259 RepID=UPI003C7EBCF7